MLVRPVSLGDHSEVAALFASAGLRPVSTISPHGCCVATAGGATERVIGFGAQWHVRLDKFRMDLLVAPDWRRQGVGTHLLSHLVSQARAAGAATLQARAESDDQESLHFLVARGFAETMRMHRQVLHVAGARLTPHAHVPGRLADRGIVLASLEHEQAHGEACWIEFCRLFNAALEGWPDPDPGPTTRLTPAEFRRRHRAAEEEHWVGPEQCYLAVRGYRYVGFTGALGTAVDPAFRRQGIATALKLQAVISARRHGVATLHTSTGNAGMVRGRGARSLGLRA